MLNPDPVEIGNRLRRSGGRAARLDRRQATGSAAAPVRIRREIPAYALLDEEALARIEDHADWILKEIGIEFRGDREALALFREAGASVAGERVRFDPGHARALCHTAPASFVLHGRDPARSITFGGRDVVLLPAYGPPFVTDLDRGRRYATIEDFRTIVKLSEVAPWLNHSGGTVCEPVDLPVNKRHLDMVEAHLRLSAKPFMGSVTAPERAEDSIAMARLVFGDAFVDGHAVIQGNINVNSPLVFDDVMSGALKAYARAGQSTVISPFILGGAMGPVTQPALIAQAHAETMAGIALAQLSRPGAPVVYGNFLTTLDLRTGAPLFGGAEATLAALAVGQLARRLGLPLRIGGHLTAAKIADGQAMQESVASMTAGLLAGTNMVIHAAGWLEGGLTFGFEKFAMDLDQCGLAVRLMQGLTVDAESLAADAYREAGPGGNYIGSAHTLRHFETAAHVPPLTDTDPWETWAEKGSPDLAARANGRWKAMLADYEEPALDPAVSEALSDFVERKKDETPDRWH